MQTTLSMGVSSNELALSITFFFQKNSDFQRGARAPALPHLKSASCVMPQSIVVHYNYNDVDYRPNSMKLFFKFYLLTSHAF